MKKPNTSLEFIEKPFWFITGHSTCSGCVLATHLLELGYLHWVTTTRRNSQSKVNSRLSGWK
jgi:hypothetical protein